MSHLGGGHVHRGSGGEAADDDIVDDEGETAHPEKPYESLYDADTEGDRRDDLQGGGFSLGGGGVSLEGRGQLVDWRTVEAGEILVVVEVEVLEVLGLREFLG